MARRAKRIRLKEIVERTDTAAGRAFDVFVQCLIVVSIITFSIETIPGVSPRTVRTLSWTETVIVVIFSVEFLLRTFVADTPRKYVLSFYGIIDLLAILPFYLSLGIDLRSLRVLRLLRVFRTFKLVRYNTAIRRFGRALYISKEEFVLFGAVTLMLLFLSAVGIYYFENPEQPEVFASVFHSLWWAVATLTTVGYGDVYPITVGGKIFTFVVLMIGLGIVAVPAGVIASALTKVRSDEQREEQDG